jgi:hypothetical protein
MCLAIPCRLALLAIQVFPSDLRSKIVTETNAHFADLLRKMPPEKAEKQRNTWKQLTVKIFNAFLAILILLGLRNIPSDRLAWGARLAYEFPVIRKIMPRNQFQRIKQYLHFCDNNKAPAPGEPSDNCYKFRMLLDTADIFLSNCHPGKSCDAVPCTSTSV